jgi:hypothetical protein
MLKQESSVDATPQVAPKSRSWIIGLTSLFFILLQSACSAVTRGCYSDSNGTAGDCRVCRESVRHLAHSLAARPAFIAMESWTNHTSKETS